MFGPKRLQEAQNHLAQARRLAPGDWRIDYAYGLVLVRQSQIKPAIVQFEAALAHDDGRLLAGLAGGHLDASGR